MIVTGIIMPRPKCDVMDIIYKERQVRDMEPPQDKYKAYLK